MPTLTAPRSAPAPAPAPAARNALQVDGSPTRWTAEPPSDDQRRAVTVDEYQTFRRDGYLVVRGLVPPEDVEELHQHTRDLMQGKLPEQQDMEEYDARDAAKDDQHRQRWESRKEHGTVRHLIKPPEHLSPQEKAAFFLRIHMLHRQIPLHERYMLHPRVLDVLEVLIGPDVLAMQTMLFLKPPGKVGQGWHQDSYYIPTMPDTLIGAWIAIDDADERNGGLWFAKGSASEPIYPPCPEVGYGFGDKLIRDIRYIAGASEPEDASNHLSPIAERYDQVLCPARKGDVVFFNGHVLHRSKDNWTADRFRRAFVSHYCNARSFTTWGRDGDNPEGYDESTGGTNASHILARGDTHLPFATPRFGTPCAALLPAERRQRTLAETVRRIAAHDNGLMGCAITDLDSLDHDHDEEQPQMMGGSNGEAAGEG